jgi:hypothetical protein
LNVILKMKSFLLKPLFCFVLSIFSFQSVSAQSIVRQWNEILLEAISNDFARPTVHARNLYHLSAMTYDIWSAYKGNKDFHFLGRTIDGYTIPFDGVKYSNNELNAQNEAISFASYRLILQRFQNSPGIGYVSGLMEDLMQQNGYDISNTSTDFVLGGPAEFGNWVAEQIINYGLQDGSNEANNYVNTYYQTVNPPLEMEQPGNPDVINPNKWQAIELSVAFDQAGNPITGPQDHLSPEWGNVTPFSLHDSLATNFTDGQGNEFKVYCDPGSPALIDINDTACLTSLYKWNHLMVSVWQSHNTPNDGVIWDISPGSIGNVPVNYPEDIEDHFQFYNYFDGGHADEPGHPLNPFTGLPYAPNLTRRGDYVRVVAEYWADGLNSETPPGHWFKILHDVLDHPLFEKRWMGVGPILDDLEYDVLSHFVLGGMMHDAALAAWSIKGWYDYTRPAAAIRWLGDNGQCTDPGDLSYNINGIPLIPGYSEIVYPGDPLAGPNDVNVGKIKLYTWRGHSYISDPEIDAAGVGWILSEDWWSYQLPTFVTPPFAGYVSGHSTFSATAANVLALITGDTFFPGGIMEKTFLINDFLEFEQGPSNTVVLQWATYKDASDQCSLSRIWGGIHPPVDDLPGRKIGDKIGPIGVEFSNEIIQRQIPMIENIVISNDSINELDLNSSLSILFEYNQSMELNVNPIFGFLNENPIDSTILEISSASWIDTNIYEINFDVLASQTELKNILFYIDGAVASNGEIQKKTIFENKLWIDTKKPIINEITPSTLNINTTNVLNGFYLNLKLSEDCNVILQPNLEILIPQQLQQSIVYNPGLNSWIAADSVDLFFDVIDNDDLETEITIQIDSIFDVFGNIIDIQSFSNVFTIDMQEPNTVTVTTNKPMYNRSDFGVNAIEINSIFSKPMDTLNLPTFNFSQTPNINQAINFNFLQSNWTSLYECQHIYHMPQSSLELFDIDIYFTNFNDSSGNFSIDTLTSVFSIDTKRPEVVLFEETNNPIFDGNEGQGNWTINLFFSESMDVLSTPLVQFDHQDGLQNSLIYLPNQSGWLTDSVFLANFEVLDFNIERDSLDLLVYFAMDMAGNEQTAYDINSSISIDTRNPMVTSFTSNTFLISNEVLQYQNFIMFDEEMNVNYSPLLLFNQNTSIPAIEINPNESEWITSQLYLNQYDVLPINYKELDIDIYLYNAYDLAGNVVEMDTLFNYLSIDIESLNVNHFEAETKLFLYPNPVSLGNVVNISSSTGWCNEVDIEIADAKGRIVAKPILINSSNQTLSFRVEGLTSGLYFIKLNCGEILKDIKLIIK